MQHAYRANDGIHDQSIAQSIISYKHSATRLCHDALIAAPGRPRTSLVDAILVLFALDVSGRTQC